MKKLIAMLMALTMVLTMTASVYAEEEIGDLTFLDAMPQEEEAVLMGHLLGWNEDGSMMMQTNQGVLYQVNIDDETNLMDAEFLTIGDFVTVFYNGMLSKSLPAQLTAAYISSIKCIGTVTEVHEGGFLMETDDGMALDVAVDEQAMVAVPVEGQQVTVFFDGRMTRSIPAQINALAVRCIDLYGVVTEVMEDGFKLHNDEMGEVIVHVSDETVKYVLLEKGEMVCVASTGMMTMSIPAQYVAAEVLPMAMPAAE